MFLLIGLPVFVAGQQTALKTNALFWATTTPNIGVEVGISHNITIELWGALRGDLYGGGVSYGYHWALGERWGIEAMIGAGYAYMKYDKLRCAECGEREGSYTRTYFGPTRIGISFIYFLR